MGVSSRGVILILCNLMLHSELPLWKCRCYHTLGVTIDEFVVSPPLRVPP